MNQPPSSEVLDVHDAPREVLAVLPLLYVAWADGVLTPSEIEEVRDRVQTQSWIDEAHRETICGWLDPQDPPSATQYFRWIRAIREAAAQIPDAADRSLAGLSIEMARLARPGEENGWPEPEAQRALADIESAVGIIGHEALREILKDRPRPEELPGPDEMASFDVQAMTRLLDGGHATLREKIRTVLSDPVFRYERALGTAAYRERVLYWCQLLADQGLGALAFPEAQGGEGDIEQFIVAFETLSYHDLSLVVKYGVQFGLFGGSIHRLGTKRHHDTYLPAVGRLDLPGCFAMSEYGHGSNVREIETTARYDAAAEEFVINTPHDAARKEWIGNAAAHGQLATVFAQLQVDDVGYGVHAFLVPIRKPDGTPQPRVRIADCGEKMGLNGVDNGRLWFDNVRIPRANLLDRFATVEADGTYDSPIPSAGARFFQMLSTLVGGRIAVARGAVSAAKTGLTIAIRYGNRRRQFGPKGEAEVRILDYPTHQKRLLPLLANAYALDFALTDLTTRYAARGADADLGDIEGQAAALKALSTWNTTDTLQTAREACGGQGYLAENRLGRLKADTDVFTTFEGDNTVLLLQVAKGLLSGFKQEFEDMNFFGLLRHLAGRAATSLTELNPVATRKTDAEHLRDPSFQQAAFTYRERKLLRAVAHDLKTRIDEGTDSFEAFMACQLGLVDLARAHGERLVLDAFIEGIAQCDDPALVDVLEPMRSLFALHHIASDRGWFLENGYIEGGKSQAIRKEVEVLCAEIRPEAEALVNAFAIPEACIAAPIAT
jgi:acyl-CoA oxidase